MSDFNKAKTTTDELLVMIVFNDNGCNYVMSYIGHNSVSKEANCSFALSHIPFSFQCVCFTTLESSSSHCLCTKVE